MTLTNRLPTAHSGSITLPVKAITVIIVLSLALLLVSVDQKTELSGNRNTLANVHLLPANSPADYAKIGQIIADSEQDLTSTIVIPITIDLDHLEARLNEDLPERLADINERRDCIKTKLLKISCEISGFIDRRGKLTVSGRDNALLFSLPVHASVSAKAGIRETAVADATFFADAHIAIDEDWQPQATVNTDFTWDRRPELMLFNLVKITFGSKVEPALRKRLKALEEKIPHLLSKLDLKSDVQQAWDKIQQPVEISSRPQIYSTFTPDFIGYTGFTVSNDHLTSDLIIKGRSRITGNVSDSEEKKTLLPLVRTEKANGTFRLVVPAIIETAQIQTVLDKELTNPIAFAVDSRGIEGRLTVNDMAIKLTETRDITLAAAIEFDNRKTWLRAIDYFDWFSFSGNVVFDIIPALHSRENLLTATDLRLNTTTSSPVADKLADTLNLPYVKRKLLSLIQYDFTADIEKGILAANKALDPANQNPEKLTISGKLNDVSVTRLIVVDGAIAIVARAEGTLQAKLGVE